MEGRAQTVILVIRHVGSVPEFIARGVQGHGTAG
jgi:hypothetical protein